MKSIVHGSSHVTSPLTSLCSYSSYLLTLTATDLGFDVVMIADEATKKDDLMWAMERPCSQDKYLFHISDLSVLVIVTVSGLGFRHISIFPWSFSSCSLFIGSKLMDLIFYLICCFEICEV